MDAVSLQRKMKRRVRHTRWMVSMVAMLLCSALCCLATEITSGSETSQPTAALTIHATDTGECTACATLSEKDSRGLDSRSEADQWGMPSTATSLQGTASRTLLLNKAAQRLVRLCHTLYASETDLTSESAEELSKSLLSKRFSTGYYIYSRCQMRC